MSNADLLRNGFEAFNRGDFEGASQGIHEDFEWHRGDGALETEPIRGLEAFRQMMAPDAFDEQFATIDETADHGDRLLAVVRFRVRGKSSGIELENVGYQVWTFEDGLARSCENYDTLEKAQSALDSGS